MLGKHRLRPSFLLEVVFLIAVWLIAWRVFNPPAVVLVFIIFAAYGLVFIYENWLDNPQPARASRGSARIPQGERALSQAGDSSRKPEPSPVVEKPSEDEPAAGHSISERLTARLHGARGRRSRRRAAGGRGPGRSARARYSAASTSPKDLSSASSRQRLADRNRSLRSERSPRRHPWP